MKILKPSRLKSGDTIGIIAPASSAALIKSENLEMAKNKLESFGFKVLYGKNIFKTYKLGVENISEKVSDIHEMFLDKKVKAIMAVIGGYTSNQLLPYLDYKLIKKNPKIFIGYSDITALQNTIFAKAGLITFSGPCFANFAQTQKPFDFEEYYFKRLLIEGEGNIKIKEAEFWADDQWWKTPRSKRILKKNEGWRIIKNGKAIGTIIGGNLSTLLLLISTPFCPSFKNKILFIEEDPEIGVGMIERMFFQLRQTGLLSQIKGLTIGRFHSKVGIDKETEKRLLTGLTNIYKIPVISNVDFGHTNPMITFPIGGECEIDTEKRLIKFIEKSVL